jgi:glycosyltransferase involved in cell wall biosynthesis
MLKPGKPLRVLVIAQYYPPDMGGGATRAYNVVKGMMLHGAQVVVVAAFPHYPHGNVPKEYRWKLFKIEWHEGAKIIRTIVPPLPSKGLAYRLILAISFAISSLLALPIASKVDIIWAANPNIISFFPALVYGLVKRAPVALNVDDLWPEDIYSFNLLKPRSLLARIAETMARIAYHKASIITPISPGYISIICGRYGVDPRKIEVVRAGVDVSKFRPYPTKGRGEKFAVLYSGAFSVAYDFEQVLKAAKLLENENVEFILQGGGEVAPYLKSMVEELRLRNVRIMDKILSRDEVAKLLGEADALILPLKDFGRPYLGISSKLYEYQAAGKPIICCADGQPAKYVEETRSGIVVKPGDYEALARAVLYLKNNPDSARELGDSGRHYVEDNLSIESIGREMIIIFNKVFSHFRRK